MAQEAMAPVTARDVGNWLKWLAEQMHAGAISLGSRVHQLASMGLQGADVALSYPGWFLTSFLTSEPAPLPEFRPYDPWRDPQFLRAQLAMGRKVPTPEPLTTRNPGQRRRPNPSAPGARVQSAETLSERTKRWGTFTLPGAMQVRPKRVTSTSTSVADASATSDLGALPVPVTPVPDQILTGRYGTVEEIQQAGLTPTYFLTPALVAANADRPIMPTELPNVGDLSQALSQGPAPDQVLMGLFPNTESVVAAGVQPTYVLQDAIRRQQAAQAAGLQPPYPAAGQRSGWLDLFQRQQDLVDILGVATERGQALRLAARRAAETPGASVAALYWEQGIEPLLRRYGLTEEQLKAKRQELYDLEAEWRRYRATQDFADFLWSLGYDPFSS